MSSDASIQRLDAQDLKDRIRKLRQQKIELQQTIDNLSEEVATKTVQLRGAKQARIIVDPDPEMRVHLSDTVNVDTSDLDNDPELEDGRFRVANEKLEMSILMQEIRAALPELEKEVRWRESVALKSMKHAQRLSKYSNGHSNQQSTQIPTLWLPTEELKDRLKELLDRTVDLKVQRSKNIQDEKEKNAQISENIARSRRDLARLLKERDMLKGGIWQLTQQSELERHRREVMREEHIKQREQLRRFHGGFGFQTIAFLNETGGDPDEKISLQRVATALKPWLFTKEEAMQPFGLSSSSSKTGSQLFSDLSYLRQQLAEVRREEKRRKDQEEFGDDALLFFEDDTAEENIVDSSSNNKPNEEEEEEELIIVKAEKKISAEGMDVSGNDEDDFARGNEEPRIAEEKIGGNNINRKDIADNKGAREDAKSGGEDWVDLRSFCLLMDRLIILHDA